MSHSPLKISIDFEIPFILKIDRTHITSIGVTGDKFVLILANVRTNVAESVQVISEVDAKIMIKENILERLR